MCHVRHVGHGGLTFVVGADGLEACVVSSGQPQGAAPQRGVDEAQGDGHHGEDDEQREDGQGPVRVFQFLLGCLENTVMEDKNQNLNLKQFLHC